MVLGEVCKSQNHRGVQTLENLLHCATVDPPELDAIAKRA